MWEICSKNHELIQFDVIDGQGDCPMCRANELIYLMFSDVCKVRTGPKKMFDHQHRACYEDAQRYLLEIGKIRPEQCVILD